jgi:mannitol-specific phosphotransferase system IIBC component
MSLCLKAIVCAIIGYHAPCRYDRGVWDKVKGRLVAAMLMLGSTFPLAEALNNHVLVSFINEQHQILRKQLLERQRQPETKQHETHRASGSESASPAKESPEEDEEEAAKEELLCARCDKYMGRVSSPEA